MAKTFLIAISVVFGFSIIAYTTYAENTSPSITESSSSSSSDVTKDNWLKAVTPILPELICKGFENDSQLKIRFDQINMTYVHCVAVIPDSVNKCREQLYSNIPNTIDSDSAAIWGKSLGECIGKDFAIKYLIPKS